MKVQVVSDLHLEFYKLDLKNTDNVDLLILSGDVLIASEFERYEYFLKQCSERFPNVVYVAGNHEFYGGEWNETLSILREGCAKYSNLYFMEKDTVLINDFTIVGGTLWTDMNGYDPITMYDVKQRMNDYRAISNEENRYKKLDSEDTAIRHKETLAFISSIVDSDPTEKYIVVGHHAPSKASTHPRYRNEYSINGAYSSNLDEFILARPQLKLWTHGHTHEHFDYMVGSTRILCNPRGYAGYESDATANWPEAGRGIVEI